MPTWVPTGHTFRKVLVNYVVYRGSTDGAHSLDGFSNWLVNEKHFNAQTANADKFPLKEAEFNLSVQTFDDLVYIVTGGRAGLQRVLGGNVLPEIQDRNKVCLVDAWIVGRLALFGRPERNRILIDSGFAGTDGACDTLFTVGSAVGEHFGLLNEDNRPTELYGQAFANVANHLNNLLVINNMQI